MDKIEKDHEHKSQKNQSKGRLVKIVEEQEVYYIGPKKYR